MPQHNSTHTGADIDSALQKVQDATAATSLDTTPGRLLKLGDFGVGVVSIPTLGTDLNTLDTNGDYYVLSPVNSPIGSNGWLKTLRLDSNNILQEFIGLVGDERYTRRKRAGAWQSWNEGWDASNLPEMVSPNDSTVGRNVTVGDHGVGAVNGHTFPDKSIDDDDWPQGCYRITASNSGTSPFGNDNYMMQVIRFNGVENMQIKYDSVGNIFWRFHSSVNGWGAESRQTIELGNNANGEYVKFPDGTLYCGIYLTTSAAGETTWTYPHAFTGFLRFQGTVNTGTTSNTEVVQVPGLSNTAAQINVVSSAGGRLARNIWVTAIGRWK